MSGAVFAAANRAPSAFGLNALALVDEETSHSCSTSSSGTASTTTHETDSETCESDSVTECSTSIATSQGSTTTTTTHLGEERPLGTCQDESETSETETESSQSGGQDHQSQELTFGMVPQSVQGAPSGYPGGARRCED